MRQYNAKLHNRTLLDAKLEEVKNILNIVPSNKQVNIAIRKILVYQFWIFMD